MLSDLRSESSVLKAGIEAMDRGHYATALRAFRNLAKTGDSQAENNIGYLYERGLGVPQDYGMALKWYKLSASKNLPEAQHNVGLLYHYGYGVAKNQSEAKKWFEKSARKGFADSEFMMGHLYQNGWGVRQSGIKALAWYKRAAKKRQNRGAVYDRVYVLVRRCRTGGGCKRLCMDGNFYDKRV